MRLIYLLLILTIPFKVSAQIKPADQQYIPQENLLINPGYEQGRVNWTISGTATVSLEQTASAVLAGLSSLKIVASSQTFEVAQFTTKSAASLNGMQAMASVRVKTNQSGVQVCSIENSVHVKCVSVDSTNQAKEYIIPFVFNSTNNGIVIKGSSGTGTTYIDDAYVGIMPANRMPEISQAQLIGTLTMTGCSNTGWTNSTTSFTTPTNTGCTYSATGDVLAPITQTYGFRISNVKAGTYFVTSSGATLRQDAAATASGATTRWSDGTNTYPAGGLFLGVFQQLNTPFPQPATFTYTSSASSVSINMQVAAFAAGGGARIEPDAVNAKIVFHIYYYPPKSKVYSGATIYPHAQLFGTVSYAGSLNCIWSITSAAYSNFAADADCNNPTSTGRINAPSTKIPAFVLPAGSPIGTYQIVTRAGFGGGASGGRNHYYRYSDGTRFSTSGLIYQSNSIPVQSEMSGQITYTSAITSDQTIQIQGGSSSGETTVNANSSTNLWGLTFEVYYFPPQDNPIIGTFEGIEKCEDDFECTDVFSAKVSSAGVVSSENLDWLNGNCTLFGNSQFRCNLNSGIFTVAPNCTASIKGVPVSNSNIEAVSSTRVDVYTYNTTPALDVARDFELICQKAGSDFKPKTAKAATTNEMMYVPNVTRPKTCYYAFGGASATLASPTNCAASPCVEVYDSCSAGTPPNRTGVGTYNPIVFANGTWKSNVPINCKTNAFTTTSTIGLDSSPYFITGGNSWMTNANGGYSIGTFGFTVNAVATDSHIMMECTADAP